VWDEENLRWIQCPNLASILVFFNGEGTATQLYVCQECYEEILRSGLYKGARSMTSQEKSSGGNNDYINRDEDDMNDYDPALGY